MTMLPRPQTLVPKEGNPNVLHVYEPMDFSNAIRAAVTPSYRPSLGGMDSEDTPTGFAPPSSTSAASDGESYGKRAKNDVFPATSGVFIPDADTGTPLDPFSMDALVRYTQRHLALMHEPVVKFAASIAQKIGKNPDSMLVNGGNLLDPKAPSVQAMFTGSPLSQAATAQAIAKAVVDLLSAAAAAQGQGNVASEPVKLERLPKTMKTENPIQAALGMVYERIGPRGIFQRGPIRGANDPSTPATSILSQLAVFLAGLHEENSTARWMWNSLPENAGIAVIRSDVVAAMEDCHAMIRDSIPDVQMWHLITGPHVRGPFAVMVAEYINEAPGELQYPNYQSTRGPNVLTGSRISAGKFREERAVQRVRKARAWFANVSYGPSEAWAYAQKVVPQCRQRIVETRSAVQQWLEACNTLVTELWHRLVRESPDAAALYRWGQDRDRYSEIISIHRELRAELADAEANKVAAEDNWKRSRTEGLPADEQANRAAALEMAVVEVDRKKRLVESELRNLGPFIERGLRRRMGIKAEYVHAMYEAFLYKKEDEIIVTLEDAIRVLGDLLKDQVQLYVQPDDQEDTNKLLELLAASTSLKQAIAAIKEAQSALVKAEKDLITFPEADKKELFHHAPVPEDAAYIAYAASGNYMSGLYASW